MLKSGRMRWAGHIVRMRDNRNAYRILPGNPEMERDNYEDVIVVEKIILKWTLEK
jgi:hypothetical protein